MNWKEEALVHAKDQDPKESCGLLLNIRGKERYYPCRNLSMTDHQCFILDPEDYIKADNEKIQLIGMSEQKTTPQNYEKGLEIFNVPTYIFKKNGKSMQKCEIRD